MKRILEKRITVNTRNKKIEKNILVCVTQQKTCERLINAAHELVDEYSGKLYVINVVKSELHFLDSAKESEALEYLFGISKSVGANLSVLKSDDIPLTIAQYADENDIGCIILGKSPSEDNGDLFVKKLRSLLKGDIEIRILS
ncbi:MAG TPA: universal stress protein UspA [Clostridia bacterium]|nr:universal stress protein UspA [Clostridia bacterium]